MASVAARALPGALLMVLAGLVLVSVDALAKRLMAEQGFLQVTWGRYLFHMLPLIVWIAVRRRWAAVRPSRPVIQLLRSALMLATTVLFFYALRRLPLSDAVAITYASPLLLTALSAILLREPVGWRRWAAVVVGFTGVLIVARPSLAAEADAVGAAMAAAFCFALYSVATRALAAADGPLTTIFYTGLVGTLATTALLPWAWAPPDAAGWAGLALLGAIGLGGHLLLVMAFARAPASLLSPLFYLELVWAILIGWAAFGDLPDEAGVLGMAVIAASGLFILRREARRPRTESP